jgi:epoxyqueuosine reductase
MTEPSNPRRPKRGTWTPQPETLALLRSSGNEINGVGESTPRRPSPFFWHPPDQQCPGSTEAFQGAYTYSELIPVAETRNESSPQEFAEAAKRFAFSHEADDIGIAVMDPLYVFEGYTISQPWVIVLALAHNYERLREVPSDETNGVGVCDVGDQYARGARSSYALANWIRSRGYHADPYPGPMAGALLLIPPAISAGLGELGSMDH